MGQELSLFKPEFLTPSGQNVFFDIDILIAWRYHKTIKEFNLARGQRWLLLFYDFKFDESTDPNHFGRYLNWVAYSNRPSSVELVTVTLTGAKDFGLKTETFDVASVMAYFLVNRFGYLHYHFFGSLKKDGNTRLNLGKLPAGGKLGDIDHVLFTADEEYEFVPSSNDSWVKDAENEQDKLAERLWKINKKSNDSR